MTFHSNFQLDEFPVPYLSTHIPDNADVIIIGGGLAGLLTLYYLTTETKLNVHLLEEGALGFHASGRDIGSINIFDSYLIKKMLENPKEHLSYLALLKNNHDILNNIITKTGIACDYHKSGGIYVGYDSKEVDSLLSLYNTIEKGLPNLLWSQPLSSADTALITGSTYFKGGLFVPNDAVFSPLKLIHGLAKFCEKSGRKILTNCIVDNVTQTQEGVNIHIRNRGVISTKRVVYCTGIYTGRIVPGVNKFLLTHKQHVIATQRISQKVLARLPRSSIVFNGIRIKVTDDRIFLQNISSLINDKFYDGEINLRSCENLRKLLRLVYPELNKVEIEFLWSIVNCSGIDGLPISGEIYNRPNEYVNIGFGSSNYNCIALSSAMIKDMIVGNAIPEQLKKLCDPKRINNVR